MVDLALLLINFAVEFKLNMVSSLERIRVAGEGERLCLKIELQVGRLDIGDGNREVDEVLCGVGLVGSLSPKDYSIKLAMSMNIYLYE